MNRPFRILPLIATALLLVMSCGKDDESAKVSEVSQKQLKQVSHLSYVPADTPYVFTQLEPFPKDVYDHYLEMAGEMSDVYGDVISAAYKEYLEESNDEDSTREERETSARVKAWYEALKDEFPEGISEKSLKNFGVSREATGSLYGVGLLPVSRSTLDTPSNFIDLMERLQEKSGETLTKLAVKGAEGWVLPVTGEDVSFNVIIAVMDDNLVLTMAPTQASETMLRSLLGLEKPKTSLADVDTLMEIVNQKKYLKTILGVIDLHRLSERFLDGPKGVDKELFEILDIDVSEYEMDGTCREEMRKSIDIMPRILLGLKELSVEATEQEWLFEVRPDIATEMQKIAHPVPGLGDAHGLFSFGMGYDLGELRKFALNRLKAVESDPYECEMLRRDPADLQEMRKMINNPASMMVQGIHGGLIVLEDVDIDRVIKVLEEKEDQTLDPDEVMSSVSDSIGFKAVVAAQNTSGLLGMAAMMAPQIMDLGLETNKEPVKINPASPMPLPFDVYAAMSDTALVLSAGINAEDIPATLFEAGDKKYPPLLAYSMDGNRYSEILDKVLSHPSFVEAMEEDEDFGEEISPEQIRDIIKTAYGVFGEVKVEFLLREDGVAIVQSTQSD